VNFKPGKGWHAIGSGVYEFNGGLRIHLLGQCRLSNGTHISGNCYPDCIEMSKMIAINGGNRKRGIMTWARTLQESRRNVLPQHLSKNT